MIQLSLTGHECDTTMAASQPTANTRAHKIEISADAEITITSKKTGEVELRKP